MTAVEHDKSNGYERMAEHFIAARNHRIGPANVRAWSRTLAPGSRVLELGCGNGIPISQVLIEEGLDLYGVDASVKMINAFRKNFPNAHAEWATVEDSGFFQRKFDAVLAWGLIFLLPPAVQRVIIHKVAAALNAKGRFLFTAPKEIATWRDSITDCESISLGADRYREILLDAGLVLEDEQSDEGENYYYQASKP
jgi:2-polyprenyl-3-methyl-5-hydroxy-6-metoxy-1,4-benzoquinol methylase